MIQVLRLIPRADYEAEVAEATGGGSASGNELGFYAQEGSPYGIELFDWRTDLGLPCWKPPYGTFSAYDLNTGERLYETPFGLTQQWGFYGLRSWGSPTLGGPVVTSGGVILIGASMDNRVRALDAATGQELWSDLVAAPAVSIPAVFTHQGVDYVVWAVGGNSILKPTVADQVVAYRLGG
jgi:quinoprotein glucose dehydrogenase